MYICSYIIVLLISGVNPRGWVFCEKIWRVAPCPPPSQISTWYLPTIGDTTKHVDNTLNSCVVCLLPKSECREKEIYFIHCLIQIISLLPLTQKKGRGKLRKTELKCHAFEEEFLMFKPSS